MARSKSGGHPGKQPNRKTRKLSLIPESETETRAVILPTGLGDDPVIVGEGGGPFQMNWVCGSCERILLDGINPGQIPDNIVIKCPDCGAYNETDFPSELN